MTTDEQIYDLIANNVVVLASGDIEIALDLPAKIIAALPPAPHGGAEAGLREALLRLARATSFNTNSHTADEAFFWVRAVAVTALASPPQEQEAAPKGEAVAQWRPVYECDPNKWYEGPAPTHIELHTRTLYTAPPSPKAEPEQ